MLVGRDFGNACPTVQRILHIIEQVNHRLLLVLFIEPLGEHGGDFGQRALGN